MFRCLVFIFVVLISILYFTCSYSLSSQNFGSGIVEKARKKKNKKSKIKIPEFKGWKYEDQVFSDEQIVNIDIIELEDGRLRAYYMYPDGIRTAVSNDEGKTFQLEDGVIIQGQHVAVLKLPDGRIRAYYNEFFGNGSLVSSISTDGRNFVKEEGIRISPGGPGARDSNAIVHPDVVALPDGKVRIYYDGEGEFSPSSDGPPPWNGILSATSEDGLNFVKDDGVRVEKGVKPIKFSSLVWSPFVEIENDLFKLYFSVEGGPMSKNGAYIATSTDGLNFAIHKRPILKIDKRLGPHKPTIGGLPGLPQDLNIVNVRGGKRLFYWSSGGHAYYSAFLPLKD